MYFPYYSKKSNLFAKEGSKRTCETGNCWSGELGIPDNVVPRHPSWERLPIMLKPLSGIVLLTMLVLTVESWKCLGAFVSLPFHTEDLHEDTVSYVIILPSTTSFAFHDIS